MKMKNYFVLLVCACGIFLSVLNFQRIALFESNDSSEISLSLNDLIVIAFVGGESSECCTGSACGSVNGTKYNTAYIGGIIACCGMASLTEGKKCSGQ